MRGPMMPAMFICKPPSVLAEAKCSGGTISTSTDADAGEAKANPIPNRKTLTRIIVRTERIGQRENGQAECDRGLP